MQISDCSSDVCSSDLQPHVELGPLRRKRERREPAGKPAADDGDVAARGASVGHRPLPSRAHSGGEGASRGVTKALPCGGRESDVKGKGVVVRVENVGRRYTKTKKKKKLKNTNR